MGVPTTMLPDWARSIGAFMPGRYAVQAWSHRNHSFAEPLLALPRAVDFVVFGTDQTVGVVSIFPESSITRERA